MTKTASSKESLRNEEIDLGRVIGLLLDHKLLIVLITGLCTLVGMAYAVLATPVYRGDALVQVERRSSISPLGDLANIMGEQGGMDTNTAAEVRILRSRMVLGEVVDRVGLDTVVTPREVPVVGNFIRRQGIPRPEFLQNGELRLAFLDNMQVPEVLKSGISLPDLLRTRPEVWGGESLLLGRFDVAEPLRGEEFTLRSYGDESYSLHLGQEWLGDGVVGELGQFLNGQVQLRVSHLEAAQGAEFRLVRLSKAEAIRALKMRLEVNEVGGVRGAGTGMLELTLSGPDREQIRRALDAVAETFLTQNVQRQSAEAEKSLAFLEEQGPEIRTQLATAEDALNQYRINMDSVDLNSEAQAIINQFVDLERQINELEIQEAQLAQRYTPNHPSYQSLLRQKQLLNNEREALNARVHQMPEAQQEVVRLTRDVEVTQAIYVNVLNKMQELQVARAGTVGNVRIIDNTHVGSLPVEPQKMMVVPISFVVGALLSMLVVMIKNLLNRGVETPEQLEKAGLPVYATIPLSDAQSKLVRRVRHRREKKGRDVATDLLASYAPADIAMEAMRSLRTSLHFAMIEAQNNRLVITGPSPSIGKSFISVNLAAACAQADQRVLVIDADMRKGHLHHSFHDSNKRGLSDLLSGSTGFDEVVKESKVPGLFYVTRGTVPPNPSELLMTSNFIRFLEEASDRFDMVILDTPPVLAVTDAVVVGKQCSTTLMVARFELNPVRELEAARQRLKSGGVVVKGAILNGVERKASLNYGYGYYNYAYN
jgi:tyrosine-protein kinase Etk/Wzc